MSANTYSISETQSFLGQVFGNWVSDGQGGQTWQVPKLTIYPFGYNITFTGLAQGTTQTSILTITANADFVMFGSSYRANIAAAQNGSTKTAAFVRMLITDSGTNEQFTSAAVDLENYCTNSGDDRPLSYPRFVAGKSTLTIQVTNYAPTAETYALDLFFDGVLVRKY
jgi:hypothetical protein